MKFHRGLKHLCCHRNLFIPKRPVRYFSVFRYYCSTNKRENTFFITTPIFYVNAAPHVGHLYSALLADTSARWNRVKGRQTLFATGTDEHGLKIQQAAAANGMDPLSFCNSIAPKFQALFDSANIKPDRFIRTTEADHIRAVKAMWTKLMDGGFIYKGMYSGWYSVSDEAFLMEEEVEDKKLPDGSTVKVSKESGHVVSWTEESNYTFRLSYFKDDLLRWIDSGAIYPKQFESSVRNMIHTLPDLSVTRDRKRLTWGIPVPGDPDQTIYVWLDALINYLTVAGYPDAKPDPWPPHIQLIGKDIVKFHAVYWPAFLIAAGLAPPSRLVVHSHWLVENVKMSKSLGNVIDPKEKMAAFGVDGFRYFLLKEGSLGSDGTYSDRRVVERINSDLANNLGNLLGRCTAPAVNKLQQFPPLVEEDLTQFLTANELDMHQSLYTLPDEIDALYGDFNFPKAIGLLGSHLHWANSLVQSHAPWVLAKSDQSRDNAHLNTVLHVAMETLRVCGILLQPVVPDVSSRMLQRLGVSLDQRSFHDAKRRDVSAHRRLGEKIVLYQTVSEP